MRASPGEFSAPERVVEPAGERRQFSRFASSGEVHFVFRRKGVDVVHDFVLAGARYDDPRQACLIRIVKLLVLPIVDKRIRDEPI